MRMLGQRQDKEYADVLAYERVRSTSPALCVIYEYTIMPGQGLRYFVLKVSEAHTSCVLSVADVLCIRNTNCKMQPYTRNRVDSEDEHSDTVTPKTKIDDFKRKWRALHVLQCHAYIADDIQLDIWEALF